MINFTGVKAITIPEGVVKKITNSLGEVLWEVSGSTTNLFKNNISMISAITPIENNGVQVTNYYAAAYCSMTDLFEPNTTYYIHAEKEYSHPQGGATGRIANVNGIGVLLEYNETDGSFTTGDTLSGSLYFYGRTPTQAGVEEDVIVKFKNIYIGIEPYPNTEQEQIIESLASSWEKSTRNTKANDRPNAVKVYLETPMTKEITYVSLTATNLGSSAAYSVRNGYLQKQSDGSWSYYFKTSGSTKGTTNSVIIEQDQNGNYITFDFGPIDKAEFRIANTYEWHFYNEPPA